MRISRRRLLFGLAGLTAGSAGSAGGLYLYGSEFEPDWLEISRVEVPVKGLPSAFEGLRVGLLSDFHLHPYTKIDLIASAVEKTRKLNPDLVLLGGDFVQKTSDAIDQLAPVLARLNPSLGIFYVLGNHDLWKGRGPVEVGLKRQGFESLINRGVLLSRSTGSIYLTGVDDCWSGNPDLDAAMSACPSGVPALLLSHEPDPADRYCKDPRISLQLSGHSHGGQVRFPGFGSPFLPPFGQKYDRGLYQVSGMWLYTNCGVGVTVPIRLNCRPEVTLVTLKGSGAASVSRA